MNSYRLVTHRPHKSIEKTYAVRAKAWLYSGAAAWHFVTIPVKQSQDIRGYFGGAARGWGSLPVTVQIGDVSWKTSIFPDSKIGAYVLPLKNEIRKKAQIKAGDTIRFNLCLGKR